MSQLILNRLKFREVSVNSLGCGSVAVRVLRCINTSTGDRPVVVLGVFRCLNLHLQASCWNLSDVNCLALSVMTFSGAPYRA